MASIDEHEVFYALLRASFDAFVEKCFETLHPGQTLTRGWHIRALTHCVEVIRFEDLYRLIVNLPPRNLKSFCFSVAAPAWFLGVKPELEIICASYSEELAKKHARDFRTIIESEWYQRAFPEMQIDPRKNTEMEVATTSKGCRLAASVDGTLTGRGADIIIIDDPIKTSDAASDAERKRVNEWFGSTVFTRLNSKDMGIIVVVMHRLHQNDLTGHLLATGDDWRHLSLPAIAVEPQEVAIGGGETHKRATGDVLQPNWESRESLDQAKRFLGSKAFAAQYQQMPVPPDGALFKASWFQRYDVVPPCEHRQIIQSWDVANSLSENADWSVCTTWHVHGKQYYLTDVLRQRCDYPALLKLAREHAFKHHASTVIIEDAYLGTGLYQQLRQDSDLVVLKRKPQADKVTRANLVSPKVEEGRVYLPRNASWLAEYESEILAFPNGRHDDQVDSTVQFLQWGIPRPAVFRIS